MKKIPVSQYLLVMFLLIFFTRQISAEIPEYITVAVFEGANPIAFIDESGKAAGFFPEILNYIFEKNDIAVEYVHGSSFQESYLKTMSGEIDIFPGIKYSKNRTKYFDFNKESFIVSWSQVFVDPDSSVETVFDLKNKKVALINSDQNGKNFIKLMDDFGIPFVPVFYDNFDSINIELAEKRIDALVSYNFYMKNNNRVKATEILFSPARSLIAVKKGEHAELLDIIDRDLKILKEDNNSLYYKLLEKWLFIESYNVIPSWIYLILVFAAAAVVVTVLFILVLRIQVKIVKKKLAESEEVYKAIFDSANDSIFLMRVRLGPEGGFTDVNKTACEKFGYTVDEMHDVSPVNITAESERAKIPHLKDRILNEGNAVFQSVYLTKEGKKIPVEVNAQVLEIYKEKYVMTIVRDLSYREEFDNLLSAVEMKYRTIADYNYDWEFWQTVEKEFIYCSPSCLRISGYTDRDFIEDSSLLGRIVFPEDSEMWETCSGKCVCCDLSENRFEFRIVRKDSTVIWVEQQSRKIFDKEGAFIGFRGSIRDIDERKNMENQLARKQKLESIGVLAGGIAHDFNNILAIIRGYAELGQSEENLNDETKEKFSTILQAANRGVGLTGQILDFARDRRSETKSVNVSGIAKEIYKLIKPSFPRTIKITLETETDANILADEGQLHQIFMNICTNSRLAMPDGGELHISIREISAEDASLLFPGDPGTAAVEVCFKDSGCGMSEKVKEKIFDPFFTTRDAGKGAGMGMSVVHGLVKQWGGQIRVESAPEAGTSVFLYFKISDSISVNRETEAAEKKVEKLFNIIVFDDENMILDLIVRFLNKEGHTVFPYSDVLEGLEYFRGNHLSIDLVITDMTMPDMSGDVLAAEIKKINSSVPVLLSSGYSDRIKEESLPESIDELIKKPFTGSELVSAVSRLLGR